MKQLTQFSSVLPILVAAVGLSHQAHAEIFLPECEVECSKIKTLGINKQTNICAAYARAKCGLEKFGQLELPNKSTTPGGLQGIFALSNVDVVTGAETLPHVTQSESSVWSSDGNTIVVNFNDSRNAPTNFSGISVSTNGGSTFTRILPSPLATGHGTNFGDPILVYNQRLATWFAGDLVSGCGGEGIGLWTSPDGITWTPGVCAHSGTGDDRESMWVDNTPTSPFYGRMYISWNNFAAGARIFTTFSDDGVTWSTPVPLTPSFIRNVQLTGGPDGTVFVAGMDEGGGGFNLRTNLMYRSIDGGATWTTITMGAPFAPAGDITCGYFAAVSPIWRYMSWGQPGVGPNGVVHYAFAGAGAPGDTGDIYYTRSIDNGLTWSAPIRLNTDTTLRTQWMPSLSVTASGNVHVYWHDRRNTTNGLNYEIWGRESQDNGATWLPDTQISDVLIPQPAQPDPFVQACYAGDYNYATAFGDTHFATWTDGRVAIGGVNQQDVFFQSVPVTPIQNRFNCVFEGLVPIVKGAAPVACTAFGDFFKPAFMATDHRLTVVCGNTVLFTDQVFPSFLSASVTELRSLVPNAAILTFKTLTPGVFTGPLSSTLRIDVPGTPRTVLTGVCHLNTALEEL